MEEIKPKIEHLELQMQRILYYLENDPMTNTEGFISKLDSVSKKLDGLLEREKIYKAKATVWGMVGAGIMSGVIWFVKLLLAKWV